MVGDTVLSTSTRTASLPVQYSSLRGVLEHFQSGPKMRRHSFVSVVALLFCNGSFEFLNGPFRIDRTKTNRQPTRIRSSPKKNAPPTLRLPFDAKLIKKLKILKKQLIDKKISEVTARNRKKILELMDAFVVDKDHVSVAISSNPIDEDKSDSAISKNDGGSCTEDCDSVMLGQESFNEAIDSLEELQQAKKIPEYTIWKESNMIF